MSFLGNGALRRQERKAIDAARLVVTCKACGEELLRAPQREVNAARSSFGVLVVQAIRKHGTACGGDGTVTVARVATTKGHIV